LISLLDAIVLSRRKMVSRELASSPACREYVRAKAAVGRGTSRGIGARKGRRERRDEVRRRANAIAIVYEGLERCLD